MKKLSPLLMLFACCSLTDAQTEIPQCPNFYISAPEFPSKPDETIIFTASVENYAKPAEIKYQWSFSGGEIIEGQGTPTIKVKQRYDYVMAFVKFEGLPDNCGNLASTSSSLYNLPLPFLFDEYTSSEYSYGYDGGDSLSNEIQLRPHSKVFVIESFKKTASEKTVNGRILKTLKDLSFFEPVKSDGITFAVNKNGSKSTQIWVIPMGASFPNCVNCRIKNYKFSRFFKDSNF